MRPEITGNSSGNFSQTSSNFAGQCPEIFSRRSSATADATAVAACDLNFGDRKGSRCGRVTYHSFPPLGRPSLRIFSQIRFRLYPRRIVRFNHISKKCRSSESFPTFLFVHNFCVVSRSITRDCVQIQKRQSFTCFCEI